MINVYEEIKIHSLSEAISKIGLSYYSIDQENTYKDCMFELTNRIEPVLLQRITDKISTLGISSDRRRQLILTSDKMFDKFCKLASQSNDEVDNIYLVSVIYTTDKSFTVADIPIYKDTKLKTQIGYKISETYVIRVVGNSKGEKIEDICIFIPEKYIFKTAND